MLKEHNAIKVPKVLFFLGTLQAVGGLIFAMVCSLILAFRMNLSPHLTSSILLLVGGGIIVFILTFFLSFRSINS